jgi:hypothetical protein
VTAAILALALAHEAGISSSRIELRGDEIRVTLTLSLEDVAGLSRLDLDHNGIVEPDEWKQVLPSIFAYLAEHFRIEGCRGEGDAGVLPGRMRLSDSRAPVTLALRFIPSEPLDRLKVRCDLFREHGGHPRHIAEFPTGGTVVFDEDRREAERPLAPSALRWWLAAAGAGAVALLLLAAAPGSRPTPAR